jgi:hypothetical protein
MQHVNLLVQYSYETLATYLKYLKHLKYTLTTYTFSVTSLCYLEEWRLVGLWSSPEAATPVALIGNELAAVVVRCGGEVAGT